MDGHGGISCCWCRQWLVVADSGGSFDNNRESWLGNDNYNDNNR